MIKADSAGSEPPIAGEVEFAKLGCKGLQAVSKDQAPTHSQPEGGGYMAPLKAAPGRGWRVSTSFQERTWGVMAFIGKAVKLETRGRPR